MDIFQISFLKTVPINENIKIQDLHMQVNETKKWAFALEKWVVRTFCRVSTTLSAILKGMRIWKVKKFLWCYYMTNSFSLTDLSINLFLTTCSIFKNPDLDFTFLEKVDVFTLQNF